MKSLIWKEWRETRWIAIGFLLISLLTSLYGKTYLSGGEAAWHIVILVTLTLLVGARTFAGEKESRTMEFLAAQPLRKTHLWALKAACGLGVVLVVFAISALFDYVLMLSDPFYVKWAYLMVLPLTWIVLALVAIYAVALLSSSVCDKTLVAAGLAVVLWFGVASVVALIDRFNPHFFQFLNELWSVPLALLWFILVVLAGSFLIVTWREVWPNHPGAVKGAAAGAGIGSLIILIILSSANIPPEKITRITSLGVGGPDRLPTELVFSVSADGRELHGWRIDLDGENFTKYPSPPLHEREHPALSSKNIVKHGRSFYVAKAVSPQGGAGYVVQKVERPYGLLTIPRRVSTHIWREEGTLTFIGGGDQRRRSGIPLFFAEKRPDGRTELWTVDPRTLERTNHSQFGDLIAASPSAEHFIFKKPVQDQTEGKVILTVIEWDSWQYDVHIDEEVADSLGFVTDFFVQYKRDGDTYLCDFDYLALPYEEVPPPVSDLPLRSPARHRERIRYATVPFPPGLTLGRSTHVKVPERILSRGPEAVRQLAQRVEEWNRQFPANMEDASEYARVEDFRADLVKHNVPQDAIRTAVGYAKSQELLESVAAGWGADMPEQLLGDAIFPARTGQAMYLRQAIYVRKENEQQSTLWVLDLESCETTKILDDIDVTSPAEPKALVAPIMEHYFAFVRDARTIWTYRDGVLKQIFPPQP
jgi:hypothetical protein